MANRESSRAVRFDSSGHLFWLYRRRPRIYRPTNGLLATVGRIDSMAVYIDRRAIYLVAILATTVVLARILSHTSLSDLGLSARGAGNVAGGFVLGLLLMSLIFGNSLLLSWIRIDQVGWPAQTLAEGLSALVPPSHCKLLLPSMKS